MFLEESMLCFVYSIPEGACRKSQQLGMLSTIQLQKKNNLETRDGNLCCCIS